MNLYSPNLTERMFHMIQQYEGQKQFITEFAEVCEARATIELRHCKQLEGLSESLNALAQKPHYDQSLSRLLMGLRSSILTQSEQGNLFANSLRNDVCRNLHELLQAQHGTLNALNEETREREAQLQQLIMELEGAKNDYFLKHQEFHVISSALDKMILKDISDSSRDQLEERRQKLVLEKNAKRDALGARVSSFNKTVTDYFGKIAEFADHEIKMTTDRAHGLQGKPQAAR